MANRIITVTGVTGVGKDYLVSRAVNGDHPGVKVANFGTLLGEALGMSRDQIARMDDPERLQRAQLLAARRVLGLQPVVLCSHVAPVEADTYSLETEQAINPKAYVVVTAPPDVIAGRVHRRNLSGERNSPEISIKETARIQTDRLSAVQELSGRLGCEMLVLENIDQDEGLANNVSQLSQLIGTIGVSNGV